MSNIDYTDLLNLINEETSITSIHSSFEDIRNELSPLITKVRRVIFVQSDNKLYLMCRVGTPTPWTSSVIIDKPSLSQLYIIWHKNTASHTYIKDFMLANPPRSDENKYNTWFMSIILGHDESI